MWCGDAAFEDGALPGMPAPFPLEKKPYSSILCIFHLRRKNLNDAVTHLFCNFGFFQRGSCLLFPLAWSLIVSTSQSKIPHSELNKIKIPESVGVKVKLSFEILAPRKKSMPQPCHVLCTVYFSSCPSHVYVWERGSYVSLNLIWNIKKHISLLIAQNKVMEGVCFNDMKIKFLFFFKVPGFDLPQRA